MAAEIVGWRAWYTGGRAFDSKSFRWEDLPSEGLLILVLYDRVRPWRQLFTDASCYWVDSQGRWNRWGWRQEEPEYAPIEHEDMHAGRVKRGATASDIEMSRAQYEAIMARDAPDETLRVDPPRRQPWHAS